jgi:hypothetical protein
MAIYNVRCCCQPQKILGTLELDALEIEAARLGRLRVVLEPRFSFVVNADEVFLPETPLIYARFYMNKEYQKELAIYSDDRPMEFWRRVRGFTENAEAARGAV